MKIELSAIEAFAKFRPKGYYEDVMAHGTVNDRFLDISQEDYSALLLKYANPRYNPTKCCEGNKPDLKMPPMSDQLRNASRAVGRVIGAALQGNRVMAAEEKVKERMSICDTCEFKKDTRCSKCGCYYHTKIKLETEKCPVGKW